MAAATMRFHMVHFRATRFVTAATGLDPLATGSPMTGANLIAFSGHGRLPACGLHTPGGRLVYQTYLRQSFSDNMMQFFVDLRPRVMEGFWNVFLNRAAGHTFTEGHPAEHEVF